MELGLGAGALGAAAFGLGLAHGLSAHLLQAAILGLAAAALPPLVVGVRGGARLKEGVSELLSPGNSIPLIFIGLVVCYQFLVSLGPTLFYDGLGYHLALPDLYLRRGAIVPTPMNAYSGIPAGIEMLYLWLLPLGGQGSVCQILHLSLGLLAACAVFAVGKRLAGTSAGSWAAAFFLSSPMVLLASGRPGIELGWSFYLALMVLGLVLFDLKEDVNSLLLAGVFAGLALGTKFQAVLLIPAIAAYLMHRFGFRRGGTFALKASAIAVLLAAPWGLKNIFFYRNLVYPFLGGGIFPPATMIDVPAFVSSAHGNRILDLFRHWPALRDFLVHPWTYAMPAETSEADNALSLIYLVAIPILPALRLTERVKGLLIFSAFLWLPMNLMSGVARFSIPALIPLSVVIASAFEILEKRSKLVIRAAAGAIFVLSALYAHSKTDALLWKVIGGEIPEKAFLSHQRPTYPAPPFAVFDWANEHLPRDSKILLIGEPRSFYLERENETSSPYAVQPISLYANASDSGADLHRRLREAGITHIYMNFAAMSISRQPMRMSSQGLEALRDFWSRDLEAVYIDNEKNPRDFRFSVLYRLLSEEEAARPHPLMDAPFDAHPHST